jgi:hypothetical protein
MWLVYRKSQIKKKNKSFLFELNHAEIKNLIINIKLKKNPRERSFKFQISYLNR